MRFPLFVYGGAECPATWRRGAPKRGTSNDVFKMMIAYDALRLEHPASPRFWLEMCFSDIVRGLAHLYPPTREESALVWARRYGHMQRRVRGANPTGAHDFAIKGRFFAFLDGDGLVHVHHSATWPDHIVTVCGLSTIHVAASTVSEESHVPRVSEKVAEWISRMEDAGYDTPTRP